MVLIPGFFGYYNAHRAIMANHTALNVVNNNIANANTPGYSRQRVELSPSFAYPPPTRSNFFEHGQTGQGVDVADIVRVHDQFIDGQIRIQESKSGYFTAIRDGLSELEGILNEPSEAGINAAMTRFFESAQALSIRSDDMASRTTFIQAAKSMLDVFQQQANQLQDLREHLVGDPNVPATFDSSVASLLVSDINAELSEIANLNQQILFTAASGITPNDLMDKRDVLLEDLSKKLNITVDYKSYNQVDVILGGNTLVKGKDLLDTLEVVPNLTPTADDEPAFVQLVSTGASINADITGGELGGILKLGGNDPDITTVRGLLEDLNALFSEVAVQINALQAGGRDLNGNIPVAPDDEIFILTPAATLDIFNYAINTNIVSDPRLIAAASNSTGAFEGVSDGRNASAMANIGLQALGALGGTTVSEYFNATISRLGVDSQATQHTATNLETVIQQLDQRRQSVQGVNLEEEMINLMRYQRGFEAASKVMSIIDEVFDHIINNTF